MKTDQQVRDDVMAELAFDPSVTETRIGVSVNDGVVTLGGFVPSHAEKYAAEKAAFRVAGVKAVAEEIEVDLPFSSRRSDADVAKVVGDALRWDVQVPESVHASVEDGRVILRGTVDWAYQKEAASNAVRRLTGVKSVTNHVAVKSKPNVDKVESLIESALLRSAVEDAKRINVTMVGSKVVLTGKVRSHAEAEDAKWAAWSALGVSSVESNLVVQ